jgi:hypothetical protein
MSTGLKEPGLACVAGGPPKGARPPWIVRSRDEPESDNVLLRPREEAGMAYQIECSDGMTVRGETMEELRTNAEQHVAEHHQGEDIDFEAVMATAKEE